MTTLNFPYLGNQVIISSGRVMIESKDDVILLFSKKGVGVSTNGTFNVDAPEKTTLNSKVIELGLRAVADGERVLKGQTTLQQLDLLLDGIVLLSDALSSNTVARLSAVATIAGGLSITAKSVKSQLNTKALSDVTYTK
mgnify:CR=1 FL=1